MHLSLFTFSKWLLRKNWKALGLYIKFCTVIHRTVMYRNVGWHHMIWQQCTISLVFLKTLRACVVGSANVSLTVCLVRSLWDCRGVSSPWQWFTQGVLKRSQTLCLPNDLWMRESWFAWQETSPLGVPTDYLCACAFPSMGVTKRGIRLF